MTKKQRKEQLERRLMRRELAREFVSQLRGRAMILQDCMVAEDAVYGMSPSRVKDIVAAASKYKIKYKAFWIGQPKSKPDAVPEPR